MSSNTSTDSRPSLLTQAEEWLREYEFDADGDCRWCIGSPKRHLSCEANCPKALVRALLTALQAETNKRLDMAKLLARIGIGLEVDEWIDAKVKLEAAEASLARVQQERDELERQAKNLTLQAHDALVPQKAADAARIALGQELETCREERDEARERTNHEACPCLHTTPCHPRCTCIMGVSSSGCHRCCSYGSKAQQVAMAEHLVKRETELAALGQERDTLMTLLGAAVAQSACPMAEELATQKATARAENAEASLAALGQEVEQSHAFVKDLFNLVMGDLEWVRAQGGRHSVCPLCHAVCERDGGPGHVEDCPRLELARRYDELDAALRARGSGGGI